MKRSAQQATALSSTQHDKLRDGFDKGLWVTIGQIAARYALSERMIAYLVADGILPAYKVSHALRFWPLECDIAMRVFRKASVHDDFIEEALAKLPNDVNIEDNRSDCQSSDYAELSQSNALNSDKTSVNTGRKRVRRRSPGRSSKSSSHGRHSDWLCRPGSIPRSNIPNIHAGFLAHWRRPSHQVTDHTLVTGDFKIRHNPGPSFALLTQSAALFCPNGKTPPNRKISSCDSAETKA